MKAFKTMPKVLQTELLGKTAYVMCCYVILRRGYLLLHQIYLLRKSTCYCIGFTCCQESTATVSDLLVKELATALDLLVVK